MIPITIQCGCGQAYQFEVEPVDGRMPSTVACPACGADGTTAANAAIAQTIGASSNPSPAGGPLRISAAPRSVASAEAPARPTARHPSMPLPGQASRTQAKLEARAKMLWGDTPQQVLVYLASQGFEREEAAELVEELNRERAGTIRAKGLLNLFGGIALIGVPLVALVIFLNLGYEPVRTWVITLLVVFWGVWMTIKGAGLLLSPKSAKGDVTEQ